MAEKRTAMERIGAAADFLKELDRVCNEAKEKRMSDAQLSQDLTALIDKHGGPKEVMENLDEIMGTAHEGQAVVNILMLRSMLAHAFGDGVHQQAGTA